MTSWRRLSKVCCVLSLPIQQRRAAAARAATAVVEAAAAQGVVVVVPPVRGPPPPPPPHLLLPRRTLTEVLCPVLSQCYRVGRSMPLHTYNHTRLRSVCCCHGKRLFSQSLRNTPPSIAN